MQPPTVERRYRACEIRADGEGKTLFGRAVEYNTISEMIYGYFTEEIAPGAFDESLASGRDIFCSIDHDMDRLLGRTSAGTLKLLPDETGIGVEVPIPDYSYARDLVTGIARKDIPGMSFIFDVLDQKDEVRDGKPHRTVTKADIFEVSFVHFPAYPATSAGIRTAFPVAGEQRALAQMGWKREMETYRSRLLLARHF